MFFFNSFYSYKTLTFPSLFILSSFGFRFNFGEFLTFLHWEYLLKNTLAIVGACHA